MIPTFTVLISVYKNDDPSLFYRALQSIFSNSLSPNLVLLIVDGPIPDILKSVIQEFYSRANFRVFYSDINQGLALSLNLGINSIDTEWIIRADADDYNRPDRFLRLMAIASEGYDLIGSSILEVDFTGSPLIMKIPPKKYSDIMQFIPYRNPFNHMSVAFRTSLVRSVGGYPDIYLREDYALWALILKLTNRVINIPEVLVLATAGDSLYVRRGGLKYALGEIALQKHLLQCKLKSPFNAFISGISRFLIFLMPYSIRGWFYKNFLRTKI